MEAEKLLIIQKLLQTDSQEVLDIIQNVLFNRNNPSILTDNQRAEIERIDKQYAS